jgi:hypothetical protein
VLPVTRLQSTNHVEKIPGMHRVVSAPVSSRTHVSARAAGLAKRLQCCPIGVPPRWRRRCWSQNMTGRRCLRGSGCCELSIVTNNSARSPLRRATKKYRTGAGPSPSWAFVPSGSSAPAVDDACAAGALWQPGPHPSAVLAAPKTGKQNCQDNLRRHIFLHGSPPVGRRDGLSIALCRHPRCRMIGQLVIATDVTCQ